MPCVAEHKEATPRAGAVLGPLLAVALLIGCIGSVGCKPASQAGSDTLYTHVSAAEAAEIIDSQDCAIVDVRSQPAYNVGHLPGAILIPLDSISDDATYDLLPDFDQTIVVYCDSGGRSKPAAQQLAEMGYGNVVEFDGLKVWEGPLEASSQ